MKLAIVGSSKLTEEQTEKAKKIISASLMQLMSSQDELIVVSGRSPKGGVDILAEDIAVNTFYLDTVIFEPELHQWADENGKEGYKSRNMKIAKECDVLLCIRSEQSKTYGSGWTADYAERIGKKVYRVTV